MGDEVLTHTIRSILKSAAPGRLSVGGRVGDIRIEASTGGSTYLSSHMVCVREISKSWKPRA